MSEFESVVEELNELSEEFDSELNEDFDELCFE